MKTMAATELGLENPRSVDENDHVNPVENTEITRVDSVDFIRQANVEEDNFSEVKASPEIMLTNNVIDELHKSFGDEIFFTITDEGRTKYVIAEVQRHISLNNNKTKGELGPSFAKPKNMWTQINRMDFGIGGLARALTLPLLGKRELRDVEVRLYGGQNTRRGKAVDEEGNIVDILAGLDSHPCWEQ